ncbi:hypothetical protein [Paraburkholderia sp.]|uniref:hypothetical protein n=1 Tax=Paraburkholderia sp. TaxID=1926495 RepID=UPI0023888152|nr:hypothetical protein [Paraburkholderia sp.]MDE1179552.1 hypothetical protein [Paraburkholderia sp.]
MSAAAMLVAGCVATPSLSGTMGAPSLTALQQMCGESAQPVDYGNDAQSVYSTLYDAYVAKRRGKVSADEYCGFQSAIAQHYTALGTSRDPQIRNRWVQFFNEQRAKAVSWRAAVDPTLRAG